MSHVNFKKEIVCSVNEGIYFHVKVKEKLGKTIPNTFIFGARNAALVLEIL